MEEKWEFHSSVVLWKVVCALVMSPNATGQEGERMALNLYSSWRHL
jgi:hypothetical protein